VLIAGASAIKVLWPKRSTPPGRGSSDVTSEPTRDSSAASILLLATLEGGC
jgi:hypothetical protein